MREYIKKLQSKEEPVRKRLLITYMAISMTFVVFVWIYGFSHKINNKEMTAKIESEIKPFTLFKNSVSTTFQNISASVGNIPSVTKLIKETETPKNQIELIPVE